LRLADGQREYARFVREGLRERSPRERLAGGFLLGSERFVAQCRAGLTGNTDLNEMPCEQRHLGRPPLSELFNNIAPKDKSKRNTAIASAYLDHGYTMKSIADFLGLHYMTVSRAVNAHEKRM